MAAWSPDQEDVSGCGGGFRPKRLVEVLDELSTPCVCLPNGEPTDLCMCQGLSTPPATPSKEPFPIEIWTFFSDSDLDQLVVDVCAEMGRRELERGRKS